MRVLVVSQYFWPENFRINELVRSLVSRGIRVDVLTGKPNYPDGEVFQGYRAFGCMREIWSGANIYRIPIFPRGFRSSIRLFVNYISFIFFGTLIGAWQIRKVKFDVIFVYAPSPLLQALPALFIAWLKDIPLVLYVQDLWPESLEATGYVRNKLIIRVVKYFVKFIYTHSNLILISSRPFKLSIDKFSPSADIIYFPNSVDSSFSDTKAQLMPELPELNQDFCVVFAGNVGSAQAVHVIIEAASLLLTYKDIRIVVLGSGSEIDWMQSQIVERKLENIFLAGRYPVEAMPYLLSKASALLVTLADREIFAATVPNKIQAYMAVGRPIIASMNGEGASLIEEAGAGLSVPAENGKALADAILNIHAMSQIEREKLGINALDYYRKHFDHENLVTDLVMHLKSIVKEN
jgi:glycosyltransferase involved in cell wall biosynthesis